MPGIVSYRDWKEVSKRRKAYIAKLVAKGCSERKAERLAFKKIF